MKPHDPFFHPLIFNTTIPHPVALAMFHNAGLRCDCRNIGAVSAFLRRWVERNELLGLRHRWQRCWQPCWLRNNRSSRTAVLDSPGLPGWKPNLLADKNRKDKQLCRYYRNIMRSEKTEIPVILQLWLFEQRIALQMLVEEDIRKNVLHRTVWWTKRVDPKRKQKRNDFKQPRRG